jgi:hypothetical protein
MNKISLVERVERLAVKRGLNSLRLTVTGNNKITLYAAPKPEERDDRVFPHMWVHSLRVRRGRGHLFVKKDSWEALPEMSSIETTVHEWPAVDDWIGVKPPISFEMKQDLFQEWGEGSHKWMTEVWSETDVKQRFQMWKSIRDAEHHDMILLKREPKWVVNPKIMRHVGFAYSFRSSERKARIAEIVLLLDMATAIYYAATGDLKEQVVEEYARPYELELREESKAKLRSKLGFRITVDGLDTNERIVGKRMHGPPLVQHEFRSSLQEQLEHFRRTRIEGRGAGETEPEIAVYILPSVMEPYLGGTFAFEPRRILAANDG